MPYSNQAAQFPPPSRPQYLVLCARGQLPAANALPSGTLGLPGRAFYAREGELRLLRIARGAAPVVIVPSTALGGRIFERYDPRTTRFVPAAWLNRLYPLDSQPSDKAHLASNAEGLKPAEHPASVSSALAVNGTRRAPAVVGSSADASASEAGTSEAFPGDIAGIENIGALADSLAGRVDAMLESAVRQHAEFQAEELQQRARDLEQKVEALSALRDRLSALQAKGRELAGSDGEEVAASSTAQTEKA